MVNWSITTYSILGMNSQRGISPISKVFLFFLFLFFFFNKIDCEQALAHSDISQNITSNIRFEQHIGTELPLNSHFINEYGQTETLKSYLGSIPTILIFTYYRCPNLCTLVLNGLIQALSQMKGTLGKDYSILTISIDPRERPSLALAKKKSYLAKLRRNENQNEDKNSWHFLTALSTEDQTIPQLAQLAGFHYFKDPKSGEYAHPSGIIIVTPKGIISQYFFGIQFDPKLIDEAVVQARTEKRGSWVEEILLYCFHYDAKLTRHGPIIAKTIRYSGIFGVFGLITFLLHLFYSDINLRGKGSEK